MPWTYSIDEEMLNNFLRQNGRHILRSGGDLRSTSLALNVAPAYIPGKVIRPQSIDSSVGCVSYVVHEAFVGELRPAFIASVSRLTNTGTAVMMRTT